MHTSPLPRRTRPAASGAALVLALTATLAGCSSADSEPTSGSDSPSASADASAEPSPSEAAADEPSGETSPDSATTTIQDEVQPPEEPTDLRNKPKGREAFSRYVVDAWIYAFVSNDPQPLIDTSVKGGCDGCKALRKEMAQRAEEGYFVELSGVGVGKTSEPKKQPPGSRVTITKTSLALPESRILNDDGTLRALSPAHPDTTFTAKVKWLPPKQTRAEGKKNSKTPGEFRLVSFGVETDD